MEDIEYGLSYKDVLLVPQRTNVESRSHVNTETYAAKGIKLGTPIITANMDTVTESPMAIAIARKGGLGIIHRFMDIERQVREVIRVKRAEAYIIENPYSIGKLHTVAQAKELMAKYGISCLLVVDAQNKLIGIISERDVRFSSNESKISEVMTPRESLIVSDQNTSIEKALDLFAKNKIDRLPLVDSNNLVRGLITAGDANRYINSMHSAKDAKGRFLVGAAIGTKGDYLERAEALIKAETDVLVLDVAHGHAESVIAAIRKFKSTFGDIPLIAGNVATKEGTEDLISAGADGIKVGIGPGAVCTTRMVAGAGMPQLTAVMSCSEVAMKMGVPTIADGGIREPGDVAKALAAGASTVMIGELFAGTDESPGYFIVKDGIRYKAYRGMASTGANISRKKIDKPEIEKEDIDSIIPEGVESVVPYRGTVADVVGQLVGGLRSGMSYSGASNLEQFRKKARFVRLTPMGAVESYNKLS
ncbi:MAG TPA: IMP dehydrogenase [Candidatus Saccharimonadales bacterium]|nr:IMP dehydrogenase [Candidatus Saccharimonadales bacterium]